MRYLLNLNYGVCNFVETTLKNLVSVEIAGQEEYFTKQNGYVSKSSYVILMFHVVTLLYMDKSENILTLTFLCYLKESLEDFVFCETGW